LIICKECNREEVNYAKGLCLNCYVNKKQKIRYYTPEGKSRREEYKNKNKEKIKKYFQEYYEKNKEKLKRYSHDYYKNNKEKIDAYTRKYLKEHKKNK